jgi:hypothetical protein
VSPEAGASPAGRTGNATAVRRASYVQRKAPVTAVNYTYLRHDLRLLGILAPAMVVLVVVSFFIFH